MKNRIRKLMAIVLAAVSIFSAAAPAAGMGGVFHFAVSAANGEYYTSGCYTYTVEDGIATIEYYENLDSEIVSIPSYLGGYTVEKISEGAFCNCEILKGLVIPSSIKEAQYAFAGLNLYEVIFSNGTTEIPSNIFSGSIVNKVTIPNTVTKVNKDAFADVYDLIEVEYLGYEYEWNEIIFTKGNDALFNANISFVEEMIPSYLDYEIAGGKAVITGCDKDVKGDIEIPKIIHGYPVTEIGAEAFKDCSNIKEIIIPDTVKTIGEKAFANCTFSDVKIPDSVTVIGAYAFRDCKKLYEVKMSANIEEIGTSAFEGCNISVISLPKSLKSIGRDAFKDQGTAINLKAIGEYYIKEEGLTDEEIKELDAQGGAEAVGKVFVILIYLSGTPEEEIIKELLELIPEEELILDLPTEITIDEENPYLTIDSQGIVYDKNKTTFIAIITDKEKEIVIPDNVTTINEYAFCDNENIEKITLPDGLKKIGDYAFINCINLKEITIPDGVTEIGETAFALCYSLKEVTIPASVNKIGDYAFGECGNLEKVTIKDGVTVIGEGAFCYCVSLKEVTIPESVTTISEDAFADSENLTIKCYADSAAQKYAEENGINYVIIAKPKASKVDIQDSLVIYYKDSAKIKATITADEGAEYEIKYESSNPKVATVDKNGNITTTGKGNTTITCTVTDNAGNVIKDTCNVTVKFQWWQWLIWILLFGFLWY